VHSRVQVVTGAPGALRHGAPTIEDVPRLALRLLCLTAPAAFLAVGAHLATPPVATVDPLLARAPVGQAAVQAATVATPDPTLDPTPAPPTPTATPAPTPTPQAVATPAAPAPPPPPVAPPPPPRSHLHSDDGRLDTAVGVYSDCSGNTALTHVEAAVDTCVGGRTYFVGHNPGVFTPLLSESVGALITWWDGGGTAHRLRVVAVRNWLRADGVPPKVSPDVVAQFQTCLVTDGSRDVIVDAVAA
jgi:hypothetical protein